MSRDTQLFPGAVYQKGVLGAMFPRLTLRYVDASLTGIHIMDGDYPVVTIHDLMGTTVWAFRNHAALYLSEMEA
tara:strand:- start:563 stop:784 length:222 start_codon:yes stop_codon:yes gene_type:complete